MGRPFDKIMAGTQEALAYANGTADPSTYRVHVRQVFRAPPVEHLMDTFVRGEAVGPWRRWFAWRPVWTSDRGRKWFRYVYCRPVIDNPRQPLSSKCWFQYSAWKGK